MLKFNHVNLLVSDVPGLAQFFERCFDFKVTERRGDGRFAVLEGSDGFILILMHGKDAVHTSYPPLFHVGFLVRDEQEVSALYQRMKDAGYEPPAPAILQRGGEPTFGFYYPAPGGIVVEVSTPAQHPKTDPRYLAANATMRL
jgi:catechol 2,3-dioxygenase-like lactoylglutathione lyase family enzyme